MVLPWQRRVWLRESVRASALLAALGAVVWLSGLPFLFPSLGPTAYLFATAPRAPQCAPRRVVGGHAVGVGAGLLAYSLLSAGVTLDAAFAPGSAAGLRLAASGVVAVGLTAAGMGVTDTEHAPACATTLIVSLGVLSTARQGLIVVLAVCVLVAEQELLRRLGV